MLMTNRGADNDLAGRQAEHAIEGLARFAGTLMAEVTTPGEFPDPTSYTAEAVPIGEATAWMLGRDREARSGTVGEPVYGLIDEAGKLNLNSFDLNTPATKTANTSKLLELLEALPGMTPELAGAIADWRDEDEIVGTNGAESETYLRRQPSHECKNANFESIEELALVNGATREILYGEDANMNGQLDTNEDDGAKTLPLDDADGTLDSGLLDYVTVFSREPTTQSDGITDRVAVGDPAALQTVLTDTFSDPARVTQLIGPVSPPNPAAQSVLDFFFRSGMTDAEFEQIAGKLMSGTAATGTAPAVAKVGLINVNTASEAVLATVPGLAPKVSAIVAARTNRSQLGIAPTWFKDAVNDSNILNQAAPFLTTQTFHVSVDAAAVGRHGRGYRRARFVIDASTETARTIYRRDLSPLGWALGSGVRQMFAAGKERR